PAAAPPGLDCRDVLETGSRAQRGTSRRLPPDRLPRLHGHVRSVRPRCGATKQAWPDSRESSWDALLASTQARWIRSYSLAIPCGTCPAATCFAADSTCVR